MRIHSTKFNGRVSTPAMLLVIACLLASCQTDHLSRSDALSQLEDVVKIPGVTPTTHSLGVFVGTVSGNCYDLANFDLVALLNDYAVLSAAGYITIRPLRNHVWDVELTQLGKQGTDQMVNEVEMTSEVGHKRRINCDSKLVVFQLSKFERFEVDRILEDGVHARVDAHIAFVITPVGLAVRKQASAVVFEKDKKTFGEEAAHRLVASSTENLIGHDLANTSPDSDRIIKQQSFTFNKHDNGWKIDLPKAMHYFISTELESISGPTM